MRHDEGLGRGADAGGGTSRRAREERTMLRRAFALSHPAFLNFNMKTMEANCLTMAMSPAIERFRVNDDAARRDAYLGYQESFNTNAVGLGLVVGVCCALERDEARGVAPRGSARMARATLMGPVAGLLDALLFGGLRTVAAGVAATLALSGSIVGPVVFAVLFGAGQSALKWALLRRGYDEGLDVVDALCEGGTCAAVGRALQMVGVALSGALAVSAARAVAGNAVPSIAAALVVLLASAVIARRETSIVRLSLGVIALCVLLAALGIV